jgi:hypothetical protein
MITEIFWKTGLGRRLRSVASPTAGAKKINAAFYSMLGIGPVSAPAVTTPPVISGTGTVGQVLTCTPGVYSGNPVPTVTRQWRRGASNISGATGLTYTLQAGDAGTSITCRETATSPSGSVTSTSNAISVAVIVASEETP